MRRFLPHLLLSAVAGLLVGACTEAESADGGVAAVGAPTTAAPPSSYYVSVGDSYAQGFQVGGDTDHGFADQLVDLAADRGHGLELVNFGCGGATTVSILNTIGCPAERPGRPQYPVETQAAAAEAFLRAHPGEVALVTVSIGGNDVTRCAADPDPIACVGGAMDDIGANLGRLLEGLRAAAGPDVPIVGITYPNVILGEWVRGRPDLAQLSVAAFQSLINPALQAGYTAIGGTFVDITAAMGAYGPMDELTVLEPYGEIPVPVAEVCELTGYCEHADIHPNTEGYGVIAQLVLDAVPALAPPG